MLIANVGTSVEVNIPEADLLDPDRMDQVIADAVRTFRREFMLAIEEAEIEARELLIEDSLAQLEAGVAAPAGAILG
jgi:hypothetical protein